MKRKNWFKSKTLWFNVIGILVGLFGQKLGVDVTPEITANGLALGNVVLRLGTNKKLTAGRIDVNFMFALWCVGLLAISSACAFQADGVAYEDETRKIMSEHIETRIDTPKLD